MKDQKDFVEKRIEFYKLDKNTKNNWILTKTKTTIIGERAYNFEVNDKIRFLKKYNFDAYTLTDNNGRIVKTVFFLPQLKIKSVRIFTFLDQNDSGQNSDWLAESQNAFETGEKLTQYLASKESKTFRDRNFECMYEISLDHYRVMPVPYWIEKYYKSPEKDHYFVQYVQGGTEQVHPDDVLTIDGKYYKYIDSQPLSTEIEHKADDGTLVYENRSYSFLRILKRTL